MKAINIIIVLILFSFSFCTRKPDRPQVDTFQPVVNEDVVPEEVFTVDMIEVKKNFLYDQYTLEDEYPYKDTTRIFQWDKIKECLFYLDSIQLERTSWVTFQNYKNKNGEAPLIKNFTRNAHKRVSDSLGIERYQSVPLYSVNDTAVAERYGRDGSLAKFIGDDGNYVRVRTIYHRGEWFVPKKYVKSISDSVFFRKAVVVDRTNQNISTFERTDSAWLVRSMNPATTGLHRPPYGMETPVGMFVIQEQKPKMYYLRDGTQDIGGFAPYASRFTNGAYIHGVPVNAPRTQLIEYSQTLGTTPRSHMCVRNATSHAKFIYDWAPAEESIVFVIE